VLEENFDFITRLEVGHVLEFFERDRPFGFESDIEDDHVVANVEDAGFYNLTFFDRRHGAVVHGHHGFELVGRVIVFVVKLGAEVGKRTQLRLLQIALFARGQRRAG
jgi:hypothetical protein